MPIIFDQNCGYFFAKNTISDEFNQIVNNLSPTQYEGQNDKYYVSGCWNRELHKVDGCVENCMEDLDRGFKVLMGVSIRGDHFYLVCYTRHHEDDKEKPINYQTYLITTNFNALRTPTDNLLATLQAMDQLVRLKKVEKGLAKSVDG